MSDEAGACFRCLHFIEIHRLFGAGIGWSDIRILVSAHLTRAPLWTLDKALAKAAAQLGVLHHPAS